MADNTEDSREGAGFFLNDPQKLNDPFPDLKYFRENRPVFYYEPLKQWFVFGYDHVATLFSDPRLSADRMKGFVDAAPEAVREDLRQVAPYLEKFVLMNDEPNHTRIRKFLHLGFNADAIHGLKSQIQQIVNELLDRAQPYADRCCRGVCVPPARSPTSWGFPRKTATACSNGP